MTYTTKPAHHWAAGLCAARGCAARLCAIQLGYVKGHLWLFSVGCNITQKKKKKKNGYAVLPNEFVTTD